MKKIFLYLFLIIILALTLPIVFTNEFKTEETVAEEKFDYGEFNEIQLLHVSSGEVESLDLDTYLYGVVASEMPANFEIEALKAQAVVARTYTIYQISNGGKHNGIADICDDPLCCQAWIDKENRFARWEESEREKNWTIKEGNI